MVDDKNTERKNVASSLFAGIYSMALVALALIVVFQIWGTAREFSDETDAGSVVVSILWFEVSTTAATVVLIYVVVLGALGGALAGLRAVAKWAAATSTSGDNRWDATYTWWYLIRPFIGAGLALIVYLTLVGGLLGGISSETSINVAGIGAMSALAGLFSKTAFAKLQEIFANVFKTDGDPDVAPPETTPTSTDGDTDVAPPETTPTSTDESDE